MALLVFNDYLEFHKKEVERWEKSIKEKEEEIKLCTEK
jgi:hypothetical protein